MTAKEYEFIIYEKKDGVAKIVFNNPRKMNAMGAVMLIELREALLDAGSDDNVRVIVLTGAGDRAFSSGQDLSGGGMVREGETPPAYTPMSSYNYLRNVCYEAHRLMERMEKPIIAAVSGYCIAGGLEFALACDFIVASENAVFAQTEVSLGILPGSGGIVRLIKAIPSRKARELIYTGARISAKEAEQLGLVNRVVPQGELDNAVKEIADKICKLAPVAVKMAKLVGNVALESPDIDSALAMERVACCFNSTTDDSREGSKAFIEKRPPVFRGH
jgi:enoyl-CoA hydratase/carnithine racemase